MKPSPLEFAREFEKLKSDLSRLQASDLKLLRLVEFWKQLAPVAKQSAYKSYADDFRSLVIGLIQPDALSDLSMDSLKQVRALLDDLIGISGIDAAPTKLLIGAMAVTLQLVTLLFYVGEHDDAISLCADVASFEKPTLPDAEELRGMSPVDKLREICKSVRSDNEDLYNLLHPILAQWEEAASAVNHDRVWCLFVDKNHAGDGSSGRMHLLTGAVEQFDGKKKTGRGRQASPSAPDRGRQMSASAPVEPTGDLVAFDNQVKTPDDPFIGVVYESLKAVRLGLRSAGFAKRADGSYRAFLSIEGSDRTFTGDSIGLAAALVSFTQLLHPEVMRHDRFIASDVAVTGSITADGEITSVNDATIAAKIERAFFSHVRYVVVPESNAATARATLDRLHERYPHRHLRLLPVSHLTDILDDRNVIRSEKVCIGEFIVKKTAHYTRATKLQVPLLAGVVWLLLAILWPLHFNPWFDRNPEYVRLTERGFEALNKDSVFLWGKEYECDEITSASKWEVGDLDGDGHNEVAFAPKQLQAELCDVNANLFVYESDGRERFQRQLAKLGEYPADNSRPWPYGPDGIRFIGGKDQVTILTAATRSMPSQTHIRLWSAKGDSLGWFVSPGATRIDEKMYSGALDTGFVFSGISNRMGSVFLLVLPRDTFFGVSPPYFDSVPELAGVTRGNQVSYVLFPPSDLNKTYPRSYNGTDGLVPDDNGGMRVATREATDSRASLYYYLDRRLRITHVSSDDLFAALRTLKVDSGLLDAIPDSVYYANLRDSVKYWTDTGFVTEGQLRESER